MTGFDKTLEVLLASDNLDAPQLLAHLLTRGSMDLRRRIVDRLIIETNGRCQAMLLRYFRQLGSPLDQLVLENIGRLGPGLRHAMASRLPTLQRAALDIMRQSTDTSLAYLAGEAISSGDAAVRAEALDMLWHWTLGLRDQEMAADGPAEVQLGEEYRRRRKFVQEGLQKAFSTQASVDQPRVLKAAAMLADDSTAWLWSALNVRSDIRRLRLLELLGEEIEPRMFGFVAQALERPQIGSDAAELLNRPLGAREMSHLMREFGRRVQLSDPAARLLQDVPWLDAAETTLHKLQSEPAARALALATRTGMPAPRLAALCRMVAVNHPQAEAREVAAEALAHLGEAAHQELELVARDAPSPTAGLAVAMLAQSGGATKAAAGDMVGTLLRDWDELSARRQAQAANALAPALRARPELLQHRLDARDPKLNQALQLVRRASASGSYTDELKRLALAGSDHRLQSAAVAALADCMSEGVSEVLKLALSSDDARVRANALEGLDQRDADSVVFLPFTTDANNRVKANAARALLHRQHPKGRQTLREMLKSEERDRVSALWVFSKLRPQEFSGVAGMMASQDPSALVRQKASQLLASA